MPTLKIYALDDQEEGTVLSVLPEGEHTIGRDKLNCKDKRVSRNHALIIIRDNSITLKATHFNPSFYKPFGGNSIRLIKKDDSVTINDGDHFAFLAEAYWYKTRIQHDEIHLDSNSKKRANEQNEVVDSPKKAKPDQAIESTSEERTKISVNENIENQESNKYASDSEESIDFANSLQNEIEDDSKLGNINCSNENNLEQSAEQNDSKDTTTIENNTEIALGSTEKLTKLSDEEDKENASNEASHKTTPNNQNKAEKKSDDDQSSKNDPSTSKTKREPCWFGAGCYRKNTEHRQLFSHQGDSDYENYEDTDIPACPYGTACYRTNRLHRKQYKHTKPPAPKPVPTTTTKKDASEDEESDDDSPVGRKKRKAKANAKNYAESQEDDYDLQDPFINDASSDDFKMTDDDDDDSDWKDSQEVEEESQERKRLLKEAKKFTQKKNKK